MITGITEEDEEAAELEMEMLEDEEVEDVDQFGPVLNLASSDVGVSASGLRASEDLPEPVTPLSPLPPVDEDGISPKSMLDGTTPLTAEALAKMAAQEQQKEDAAGKEVVAGPPS